MSHPQNEILMDNAYFIAESMFDATAPGEVIMTEAKKIYEELLGKSDYKGYEYDEVFTDMDDGLEEDGEVENDEE